MMRLKCIKNFYNENCDSYKWFTEGEIYDVFNENGFDCVKTNVYGVALQIDIESLRLGNFLFCVVGDEQDDFISSEGEEEMFNKLETTTNQEPTKADIAKMISDIQQWMKRVGCDSLSELVITNQSVGVCDDGTTHYPKEGGVGTILDFLEAYGNVNKITEKFE